MVLNGSRLGLSNIGLKIGPEVISMIRYERMARA